MVNLGRNATKRALTPFLQLKSENDYFQFMQQKYKPNLFEVNGKEDTRFVKGSHNAWVNGQRFYQMLQMFGQYRGQLPEKSLGLDIGAYPATWIRLSQYFWSDIDWHGIGLCMSDEFQAWAAEHQIMLAESDMDPFYVEQTMPLPYDDNSVDTVMASEIFEHLISPLQFLEETSRVLKSGGLMMLTTPNVSNIGAIIHLLKGESNYERLLRSPMFLVQDEWRGHIRFYSKDELGWLANRYGFDVVDHCYYHDDYPISVLTDQGLKAKMSRLIRRIFGVVPWFRGGHVMMLRRR